MSDDCANRGTGRHGGGCSRGQPRHEQQHEQQHAVREAADAAEAREAAEAVALAAIAIAQPTNGNAQLVGPRPQPSWPDFDSGVENTAVKEAREAYEAAALASRDLPQPPPGVTSRAINAAKARAEDPLKDWTPPPREECPICLLPLPLDDAEIIYRHCCGKSVCSGCIYGGIKANHKGFRISDQDMAKALKIAETCPFCRTRCNSLDESDMTSRVRKRAESGIAEDMCRVGECYYIGGFGLNWDKPAALEWYRRAADAGSSEGMAALGFCYLDGDCGLDKDFEMGMQCLQRSAELGNVKMFIMMAYEDWMGGEIEKSVLNFRKGSICGHDKCLHQMFTFFRTGFITKEEYALTLRAYHTAVNDMKSKARDDSIIFRGRQGHTMLEAAQLLMS